MEKMEQDKIKRKRKNRRFNIHLFVCHKLTKKIQKKVISFGLRAKEDFIDHKNLKLKSTLLRRLKNQDNIFHANYWRKNLLNGDSSSLKTNFIKLIDTLYVE